MRNAPFIVAVLLLIAAAVAAPAAESEPSDTPDYSRKGLLRFVIEQERADEATTFRSGVTVIDTTRVRVGWIPFAAPLVVSTAADADVTVMPILDPFTATQMSFPYTSGSFRSRYEEWKVRRILRRNEAD